MSALKKTTEELVQERLSQKNERTPITIIADNIRSLDNVGLIFRLCELINAEKLYLAGYTGCPASEGDTRPKDVQKRHQRRIEKTAVYALNHQPWEHVEDPVPLVQLYKNSGHQIIALEQTTKSVAYHKASYQLPAVLIIGHERQGVRQELVDVADTIIEIPILGIGNSHNVATATGIVLHKILEQTEKI